MAGTRNEICTKLWKLYQVGRKGMDAQGGSYDHNTSMTLKEVFAHEIFYGAKLEFNEATANAASNTVSLSGLQSMVLASRGKLMDKYNLKYETTEDAVRNMGPSIIDSIKVNWTARTVCVTKTDGTNDFDQIAKLPFDVSVGDIAWVLEQFVAAGEKNGKVWSEMTKEDRAATPSTSLRAASSMPKYLQKRRLKVDSIIFNHDGREAWAEVTYIEIEPFAKNDAEEQELMAELGISAAEAEQDQTEGAAPEAATTNGELAQRESEQSDHHAPLDLSGVSLEDLNALVMDEVEPPEEECIGDEVATTLEEELP